MIRASEARQAASMLRALLAMVRNGEMNAPSGTVRALQGALLALEAVSGDHRSQR